MEEKKTEQQKLEKEELKEVAGGDIFDDIACYLGEHDEKLQECTMTHDASGVQIDYRKYVCSNCKKAFYYIYNFGTGDWKKISREEYEARAY